METGYKWWEEQEKLWKKLVPAEGRAKSVQGELIRCMGKLTDEAYRNGNGNWDEELTQSERASATAGILRD